MRRLRILHLSDLHERTAYDGMPASRQPLLDWDARQRGQLLGTSFRKVLKEFAAGGIDLVCFTGDLADWGHPAEYERAGERLGRLLELLNVPRHRFYAVPGNHDIQRGVAVDSWRGLRAWLARTNATAELGAWLLGLHRDPPVGAQPQWLDEVLTRSQAFWRWQDSFRGVALARRQVARLGFRETLPAGSFEGITTDLQLVGLDSAWLCGADESHEGLVLKDQGSIVLTEEQVEAHVRDGEAELVGYRLALVHHPLDHLADHVAVRRLLGDGVDLLLHGHQHDPALLRVSEPGTSLHVVAAGCLVEGERGRRWPNGFQLIEIDPVSRGGAVHFRKWATGTRFWAKGSDLYADAPDGVLDFETVHSSTSAPTTPSTPAAPAAPAAPSVAPAYAPAAAPASTDVLLRFESLRLLDMGAITRAIAQHGRQWPAVRIEWPPSVDALIAGLRQGLQGTLQGAAGTSHFAANVPAALDTAAESRRRAAQRVPGLVRRARDFSDDQLRLVLASFLRVAVHGAHSSLAHYASWEGLRPWRAPPEWQALAHDPHHEAFAGLMGWEVADPSQRLVNGRLTIASGHRLYGRHGSPGLYVLAPRQVVRHPDASDLCQWFIPQLEYVWPADDLPEVYGFDGWFVDKTSSE